MNEETIRLFTHLWRGGEYAYFWTAQGKQSRWFSTSDPLPTLAGDKDYYFGVHPTAWLPDDPAHHRSTRDTVTAVNTLFGEFDAKDFDGGLSAALAHIETLSPVPSVIIFSGGGYHCYWLLEETFEITTDQRRDQIDSLQKAWVGHIRSDEGAKDLARLLRIPGTRNLKPKYAPNFPTVEIVQAVFARLYTLADFDHVRTVAKPAPVIHPSTTPPGKVPGYVKWFLETPHTVGARNTALNWTAFKMWADGFSVFDAEMILLPRALALGLDERSSRATIWSPYKK